MGVGQGVDCGGPVVNHMHTRAPRVESMYKKTNLKSCSSRLGGNVLAWHLQTLAAEIFVFLSIVMVAIGSQLHTLAASRSNEGPSAAHRAPSWCRTASLQGVGGGARISTSSGAV